MQGYVYLKRKLSGGSILSATIPAVTEEKHFGIFLLFRRLNLPPSCLGMSGSEDEAAPVTKAEFGRLLTAIAGIQDQMQSMKRELVEDREAANERLVKRIRLEKAPLFKKKGHEKQFRFNEEVREKIAAASDCLIATPPAVERAREALKEGEDLIVARQKAIRIADRSEYGWATVEEYEEDELAANSDDEKRLYRAEMRAGRKCKAAAAKGKKKRELLRKDWRSRPQLQLSPVGGDSQNSFSLASNQQSSSSSTRSIPVVQSLGPCFLCGRMGNCRIGKRGLCCALQ